LIKFLKLSAISLLLAGCAWNQPIPKSVEPSDIPEIITKPRLNELPNLRGPAGPPVTIAVYSFTDKTGQRKPNDKFSTFSSAVTQGSEVFLIKALQDAGSGKWFKPVERVGLDDLIKERQLIRNQRETYEGQNAKPLAPMLVAGIMLQGGVIGYDSNVGSGGVGARFLGIDGNTQYRTDEVSIVIRLVSVHTGEVLLSSGASKTVYSTNTSANVLKFIDAGTKALEFEAGLTINEPTTYAVRIAIEAAVVDLIKQGIEKKLWQFAPLTEEELAKQATSKKKTEPKKEPSSETMK
jgi:curli production assembly/transport component CsgG